MTITYPLSLPSSPGPSGATISPYDAVGMSQSPFTGQQEIFEWQTKLWGAHFEWAKLGRDLLAPIIATLTALKGKKGTILLADPLFLSPRGSGAGTPVINGPVATRASQLTTKGWTANASGVLKAGDRMQIGSGTAQRVYMALADVDADGSGHATIDVWPNVREALSDGAAITLTNPKAVFRLIANAPWNEVAKQTGSIAFDATEAL